MVMSALHLKADMCSATTHACFGPIADIPRPSIAGKTFEKKYVL